MPKSKDDLDLIRELLNSQPDSVVWFEPLFTGSTNTPVDFIVGYANHTASQILGKPPSEITGSKLKASDLMDPVSREQIFTQCLTVWKTGTPSEFTYYSPSANKHFNVQRSKVHGGILSITRDRTQEVIAEKEQIIQSELLNSIIHNSPYGVVLYESMRDENGEIVDFMPKIRNQKSAEFAGFNSKEVEGKTVRQVLAPRGNYEFFNQAVTVVKTGEVRNFEYYSKFLDRWIFFSMVKFGDGVLVNNIDISQRKLNERIIEEQKNELQSILDASINSVFACEAIRDENGVIYDLIVTKINKAYSDTNGRTKENIEGKRFSVLYPETKKIGLLDNYCQVISTGKSFRTEINLHVDGADGWFDISAVKNGENGVVVTFTDISIQKNALNEINEKKDLLDKILKHSPSGIAIGEVIRDEGGAIIDSKTILANEAAARHSGLPLEIQLSKTAKELEPNYLESPLYKLSVKTLKSGISFHTQYFLEATNRWLEMSVAKMDDNHLVSVFDDITVSKQAQLEIEKSAEKLNTIINTSQAGFFMGLPMYNDSGEIIDFKCTLANQVFSQFVGKTPAELIGHSGAEWFPKYKTNGLFERFRDTYISGNKKQFDFFYKGDQVEVWANIMITRLGDELLGSFTDFTQVKNLQLQLEKLVEDLRTSNANLEDFAYAASHDLQEPLRKIDVFSDRLRMDLDKKLTADNRRYFDRISISISRMRSLIEGLLAYSKVSTGDIVFSKINLNDLVANVISDLEASVSDLDAKISVSNLPEIYGDERQIRQLFQNLISNALKYRKKDIAPYIQITGKKVYGNENVLNKPAGKDPGSFVQIEISDNGIGFEQKNAEKIFQVFQRLHTRSEFEGTGVGLAIVQKVVNNHKGTITAKSSPDKGATFYITFPLEQ